MKAPVDTSADRRILVDMNSTPDATWNQRYLDYCAANGHAGQPEAMLAADAVRYPGAKMAGFILWAGRSR